MLIAYIDKNIQTITLRESFSRLLQNILLIRKNSVRYAL